MDDGQGSSATLAEALVAAQAAMPAVTPDGINPHFSSKFVTLGKLLSKTRPILNQHGITLVQMPSQTPDGQPALTTRLVHKSGESTESTMPLLLAKKDPQGLGSALTYARRYALAAALAIADQEDDDGNAGSEPAPASKPQTKVSTPSLDPKRVDQIATGFKALSLNFNEIGLLLGSCGIDGLRANSKQAVEERISSLTEDQATQLEAAIDASAETGVAA